jgi:hypothetical protein
MNRLTSPCELSDVRVQGRKELHFSGPRIIDHSERIMAMKQQEETKYRYEIYLNRRKSAMVEGADALAPRTLDPELLVRICEWNFRVIDHCNFPRELAETSLSIFNRCVASCQNSCLTEGTTWLTGMVALHLAIKIHHSSAIGLDFLITLSRNQFTAQQIIAMENHIVRTLLWYLHPPTATEFAYSFISLLHSEVTPSIKEKIFEWSKFVIHSSVCNADFVPVRPSSIALAAVRNVMEDMKLPQEGNKLTSFFENDYGCDLSRLCDTSEESKEVKLLQTKLREMMLKTHQYKPDTINI